MTGRRFGCNSRSPLALRTTGIQNYLRLPGTTSLRVRSPWLAADEGRSRADRQLEHIPAAWRTRLQSADPLHGLQRRDVKQLLGRYVKAATNKPTDAVLETAWAAATRDQGADYGADPFYLRFLIDGVIEGRIDLTREESIPRDLSTVFEQLWMELPTDHDYALHQLLAMLSILREYTTDELMHVVLNESRREAEPLSLEQLQSLRAKAGKLLVYDGDRYGLFHDRFAWFLTGRPAEGLAMALQHYEDMDCSGRIAPHQVAVLHGVLGALANQWSDTKVPSTVREYALQRGPYHLLMAGRVKDAAEQLTNYATANERLKANTSDAWASDVSLAQEAETQGAGLSVPDSLAIWVAFALERAHLLRRGDELWPANKILLQLATEHADDSPVTQAAEAWLEQGHCDWLWLRASQRPAQTPVSSLSKIMEGHTRRIGGVIQLSDGRLVSWCERGTLRVWDPNTGRELGVLEGHNSGVLGALELSDGRIVSWSEDHTLRVWVPDASDAVAVLEGSEGHRGVVTGAMQTRDGRLVSWSYDGTLRIWDLEALTSKAFPLNSPVMGVHELREGKLLCWVRGVEGVQDPMLYIIPLNNGKELVLKGRGPLVLRGVIELSDGRVVSWHEDCVAGVWDIRSGELLGTIASSERMTGIDRQRFLMFSRFWDGMFEVRSHYWEKRQVMKAADDQVLVCCAPGVMLLNLDRNEVGAEFTWSTLEVRGGLRLSDGRWLFCLDDNTLRVLSADLGSEVSVLRGHHGIINGARELTDSRILSWSKDGTLRVWDLSSSVAVEVFKGHHLSVDGARELFDGRILSWSRDLRLHIWNRRAASVLAPSPQRPTRIRHGVRELRRKLINLYWFCVRSYSKVAALLCGFESMGEGYEFSEPSRQGFRWLKLGETSQSFSFRLSGGQYVRWHDNVPGHEFVPAIFQNGTIIPLPVGYVMPQKFRGPFRLELHYNNRRVSLASAREALGMQPFRRNSWTFLLWRLKDNILREFLPVRARRRVNQGKRLLGRGEDKAALAALAEAEKLCRGFVEAYRGELEHELDDIRIRQAARRRQFKIHPVFRKIDSNIGLLQEEYRLMHEDGWCGTRENWKVWPWIEAQEFLANIRLSEGAVLWRLGERKEAITAFADAEQFFRGKIEMGGGGVADLANTRMIQGNTRWHLGEVEEALAAYVEAEKLYRLSIESSRGEFRPGLALTRLHQGVVLAGQGDGKEELAAYAEAEEIFRELIQSGNEESLPTLAKTRRNQGAALYSLGKDKAALEAYAEVEKLYQYLIEMDYREFLPDLSDTRRQQRLLLDRLGEGKEALAAFAEADKLYRDLDLAGTGMNKGA